MLPEVCPLPAMIFLKDPLLGMVGMIIPHLLEECETIADFLLLGNTENMAHLLVLVYVTMMTIEGGLHHLHLNERGLLPPQISGVVIPLHWNRLIAAMGHLRHLSMIVTKGGQMKNIRQLMFSPPGRGRVPLRGQGKIMTESHPGNLFAYFFQCCMFISERRDYPEYRRPATPQRYAPEYPRVTNDSPAARYRLVSFGAVKTHMFTFIYRRRSESPRPSPSYDGYQANGYVSGSAGPPAVVPPRSREYPPPRNNRDIIEPVGNYRRT